MECLEVVEEKDTFLSSATDVLGFQLPGQTSQLWRLMGATVQELLGHAFISVRDHNICIERLSELSAVDYCLPVSMLIAGYLVSEDGADRFLLNNNSFEVSHIDVKKDKE